MQRAFLLNVNCTAGVGLLCIYAVPCIVCCASMQCHALFVVHLCSAMHHLLCIYAVPCIVCCASMQCHALFVVHICSGMHFLLCIYEVPCIVCCGSMQCHALFVVHLWSAMHYLLCSAMHCLLCIYAVACMDPWLGVTLNVQAMAAMNLLAWNGRHFFFLQQTTRINSTEIKSLSLAIF